MRKPVFRVSNQVGHKTVCTATKDGKRLEISDLGSRWIVLFMPPTLKKLMGHIAFGASVSAWVRACVRHTFCTHCNF